MKAQYLFIIVLFAIFFLMYLADQEDKCSQSGGTYVRTLLGMECIKTK